jgi:hypothetical protein
VIEPYDELGHRDPRMPSHMGLWGMTCFNAMSEDHQKQLVVDGKFRGYDSWRCSNPAEIGIETDQDMNPGPRFYCRSCAIEFLLQQRNSLTPDQKQDDDD